GWSVENYGVDPDIEVEYRPEDYVQKKDPQIDRGLKEVLKIMESTPHEAYPIMKDKPNLALPKRLKSKG
ncbi:MAG: hypothetical protein K2X53_02525, partial [Alphaproteobacteria bacterium]|nr:hypothetical protein [Alphaproteobacteria bacterium]